MKILRRTLTVLVIAVIFISPTVVQATPYTNDGLMIGNAALFAKAGDRQYLSQAHITEQTERIREMPNEPKVYPVQHARYIWTIAVSAMSRMKRKNVDQLLRVMVPEVRAVVDGGWHDVYYDDFVWVALAFMQGYHLVHQSWILREVEHIMTFEESGWWTPTGGVLWHKLEPELPNWKCFVASVSTGGTEQIALELYLVTHRSGYLRWALKAQSWMETHLWEGMKFGDRINLPYGCPDGPNIPPSSGNGPNKEEIEYADAIYPTLYYREIALLKNLG